MALILRGRVMSCLSFSTERIAVIKGKSQKKTINVKSNPIFKDANRSSSRRNKIFDGQCFEPGNYGEMIKFQRIPWVLRGKFSY